MATRCVTIVVTDVANVHVIYFMIYTELGEALDPTYHTVGAIEVVGEDEEEGRILRVTNTGFRGGEGDVIR